MSISISEVLSTIMSATPVPSRDLAIITLVTEHKLTLNAATKAYATYARDNGLSAAIVSYKEAALVKIASEYPVWDHIAVAEAVVVLADCYDIATSTARDYTKAYSASIGVTHPKLDPRAAIFEWFKNEAENHEPEDCKEAFIKFATIDLERSKSNANEYWKGYELHMFLVA